MMKKLLFLLLMAVVLFTACKKDEPAPAPVDYGTMTLSPKDPQTVTYNSKVIIKPVLSSTGLVNNEKFTWSVSDPNILNLQVATIGNSGEVTGNRIGTAYIRYISGNGKYKDSVKVTVKERQIFRKIYFTKGATLSQINNEEGKQPDSISGNFYFYKRDVSSTQIFKRVIYQLESSGLLIATFTELNDNAANQTIVSQYVEERFRNIGDNIGKTSKKGVTFFDANAAPLKMYDPGTLIGVFQNNVNLIQGVTLGLGVVIVDETKI